MPHAGLYYYGARWYDPALARFVQADTVVPGAGDPQALNRYSYVRNNPLNLVDPTGHGWEDDVEEIETKYQIELDVWSFRAVVDDERLADEIGMILYALKDVMKFLGEENYYHLVTAGGLGVRKIQRFNKGATSAAYNPGALFWEDGRMELYDAAFAGRGFTHVFAHEICHGMQRASFEVQMSFMEYTGVNEWEEYADADVFPSEGGYSSRRLHYREKATGTDALEVAANAFATEVVTPRSARSRGEDRWLQSLKMRPRGSSRNIDID